METKVDRSTALSFRPPPLVSPTHLYLQNTAGGRQAMMNPALDYVVHMPPEPLSVQYGLELNGGRNVVVVGGEIKFPHDYGVTHGNRAIFIKGRSDQTVPRTVYIEGLKLGGYITEGFNVDGQSEPGLTIIMQNLDDPDELIGTIGGHHSDFFQCWNGPTNFYMDRCRATPGYQTFMLQPKANGTSPVGEAVIRRMLIDGTEDSGVVGYMVTGAGPQDRHKITSDRVLVKYNPTKPWPEQVLMENPAFWGDGFIPAPAGAVSFCTGAPGLDYVSPGFETLESVMKMSKPLAYWPLQEGGATTPDVAGGRALPSFGIDYTAGSGPIASMASGIWQDNLDRLELSDPQGLEWDGGDFSIEMFARVNNVSSNRFLLSLRASGTADNHYSVVLVSGQLRFDIGGNTWFVGWNPPANEWHHLVLTYRASDGERKFYLDGTQFASTVGAVSTPPPGPLPPLLVGRAGGNVAQFVGRMAHLALYRKVLSAPEVANHWRSAA